MAYCFGILIMFVMYDIPEGNNVTITGKIAEGQTWQKKTIDIRDVKGALKRDI